jgi:hypothetical protein
VGGNYKQFKFIIHFILKNLQTDTDPARFLLPETVDKSILFTQTEFTRLCRRIKELEQE